MGRRVIDISGLRSGRLVAVKFISTRKKSNCIRAIWLCRCDCGEEKEVIGNSIRTGATKSCGCLKAEMQRIGGRMTGRRNQPAATAASARRAALRRAALAEAKKIKT